MPTVEYPPDLPVSAARAEIAAAVRDHQVVVLAGETGSGKTTQLPKICLELGRGIRGMIGHTQPRRIAARSVAERLGEELGIGVGGVVGYQVRFTDHSTADTLVKVMTDGILLAELQHDRDLRRYDTIIIDEAHERSLTIDFLIGYLTRLLPRRPDLKVIITSATIDPQAFADHFSRLGHPVPIIEVSGRTYPVEVRYRPLERSDSQGRVVELDQVAGVCEAVEELWTEGPGRSGGDHGGHDILVFLSGEREIRDCAEAVTAMDLPNTQVLPLYGRLSAAEQHRVFSRHPGRRIVLATNVAETSLTVPGIRYVVDTGTARISRYSRRTKVQRLPIEPISQAAARQRSGRCGRTADGVAIRLYSEEDHDARPAFTEPEVLRTNLASVILQMTALGLGDIARFPFIDPPDSRAVRDGIRLLEELGAFRDQADEQGDAQSGTPGVADPPSRRRLSRVGRSLARIPLDPRLARMMLQAAEDGTLREVLTLVSALSIQDVRERPADRQTQADQAHARFRDQHSDFVGILNLWEYLDEQRTRLSGSAFRRLCKGEYLHYLRVREWQDLRAHLGRVARELRLGVNDQPADRDAVHRSLLAGLCSHIGWYDPQRGDYLGARGARFLIQPGSALFRRAARARRADQQRPGRSPAVKGPAEWVMAAELVETSRLWARTVAPIDPAWAERVGAHLVKRTYSEPRWSSSRAGVVATERVTLYGVPLATDRTVAYGRIDPETSRALFIRHALVEGDWRTSHGFLEDNRALLARLEELEERTRRRDIVVSDDDLAAFYDARVPAGVVSGAHFDRWWKTARRATPDLLTVSEDSMVAEGAPAVDLAGYPEEWRQGEAVFPLTYQFAPGQDADGVTVHIPVQLLNQVSDTGFDWLVPGLRAELAIALLRSLPKATRRRFVPAPDHAVRALAHVDPDAGPVTEELARGLWIETGHRVDPGEWDWDRVPGHLRITFRIEDRRGRTLAEGKDLEALRAAVSPEVRDTVRAAGRALEQQGLTSWTFGDLPTAVEGPTGRGRTTAVVIGYPALVDHGSSVAVEVQPTRAEADAVTRLGVRRLLLLNTAVPWPTILSAVPNQAKAVLAAAPHADVPALLEDCVAAAMDGVVDDMPPIRDPAAFEEARRRVRAEIVARVSTILHDVIRTLELFVRVELALGRMRSPVTRPLREDVAAHLRRLVHPGFVTDAGVGHLPDLPRYLEGMLVRVERAAGALDRDATLMAQVHRVERQVAEGLDGLPPSVAAGREVRELRWLLEELRVSLFAQTLGTARPVSEKRIAKALDAATSGV